MPSRAGSQVSGFSQSYGGCAEREPIRSLRPARWSSSATRRPVLPVPPRTSVPPSGKLSLPICITPLNGDTDDAGRTAPAQVKPAHAPDAPHSVCPRTRSMSAIRYVLDVGDDISPIGSALQSRERHAISRKDLLRVSQPGVQQLHRPHGLRLRQLPRIPKPWQLAHLTANDSIQVGSSGGSA